MVSKNVAAYETPKQTRSVLLYWRLPEEWAEVLHGWVRNTLKLYDYDARTHADTFHFLHRQHLQDN
jgi:hypothetical protein